MNKALFIATASLLGFLPAQAEIRNEEILLQWQGQSELTSLPHRELREGQRLPEVIEGTLGSQRELLFTVDPDTAPRGRQFIDLNLPGNATLERFTVACYVYPTRRNIREELLYGMPAKEITGFSLRSSWGLITFAFGDGGTKSETIVRAKGRSNVSLDFNTWQHIAAVFDQGTVRIYKNGVLIETEETGLGKIAFAPSQRVRLGAHLWAAPNSGGPPASYPFEGRMTGLFISSQALEEDDILELMQKPLR